MVQYVGPVLKIRDLELDHMLNAPSGEVGDHLDKIARVIVFEAKRIVDVRTGNLRRSIHSRHARDARGQYVEIGSPLDYALLVHEGSPPHEIIGHGGRMLRFVVHGRVVYARHVTSPGFRGRHYLTIPLRRNIK